MSTRAKKVHIVVVGSTNFDIVVKASRMPREGENLLASGIRFFHGGKGANQAVAASRLGARTTFLGAVGRDLLGDFLLRGLKQNRIETAWVKRSRANATGCAFIPVFPSGNNSIIVDVGANLDLMPRDVERAAPLLRRADALCTVLELRMETVEAALRMARRAGKLAVLDAGPPRGCPPEVLKLADIVSPNETELEALSGVRVDSREAAREAGEQLLAVGVRRLVLKLGSDGSMLVSREGAKHFPARRVEAVDPTAAGDAFTAALAVELAAGKGMDAAIEFANCAGALAVTKMGAQTSMPMRKDVEAFRKLTGRPA